MRSVFALTLALEAVLLLVFAVLGYPLLGPEGIDVNPPWRFYGLAALPALAMGLQNATLHRVAGTTIRTTYISGVLTSMADEVSKYPIWLYDRFFARQRQGKPTAPSVGMILLLLGVWLSYVVGGLLGVLTGLHLRLWGLAVPIGGLLVVMCCDLIRPLAPGSRQEER